MKPESTTVQLSCLLMAVIVSTVRAHESPIERVARMLRLWTGDGVLHLRYEEAYSERSALLELHAMDTNADGIIQATEQRTYFAGKADGMAAHFDVRVGNAVLKAVPDGDVVLRRGWRQVYNFSVPLTAIPAGTNALRVAIRGLHIQPGEFQWTLGAGPEAGAPPRSGQRSGPSIKPVKPADRKANRKPGRIELDFLLEKSSAIQATVPGR